MKTDSHRFNDDFNRVNNPDTGAGLTEISGDWQIDGSRLFMPNAETDAVIIYPGSGIVNAVIKATFRLETEDGLLSIVTYLFSH